MSHLAWLKDYRIPRKHRMKSVIVQLENNQTTKRKTSKKSWLQKLWNTFVPLTSSVEVSEVSDPQVQDSEAIISSVSVCTQTEPVLQEILQVTVRTSTGQVRKRKKCFKCSRWGYVKTECPNPKKKKGKKPVQDSPTSTSTQGRGHEGPMRGLSPLSSYLAPL